MDALRVSITRLDTGIGSARTCGREASHLGGLHMTERSVDATPMVDASSDSHHLAYVKVANTIRAEILSGRTPAGERLPSEAALSERFGVGRTTIREALRVLVAQGLIRTQRGANGGSTVTTLTHPQAMDMLELSLRSLAVAQGCSLEEMDEVRELLDVTATWLASSRRTPEHVRRLYECIPPDEDGAVPTPEQINTNLLFHYRILEATGNRLLHLFGEPVSILIYSFFRRQEHRPEYYHAVTADHLRIARAIEQRDPVAAQRAMSEHIAHLRHPDDSSTARSAFTGLAF